MPPKWCWHGDLSQDVLDGGGPDEGFWGAVPVVDVGRYRVYELADAVDGEAFGWRWVSSHKKRSTRSSQDAEVGTKWKCTRGCRSRHGYLTPARACEKLGRKAA